MVSAIDPTVPIYGAPTTISVRNNFAAAKAEIEALQISIPPSGSGGYLELSGGVINGVGSTPALTINTSNNGPITMNGLLVKQGYQGGGLAMDHGVTGWTGSFQYGSETFHDHFSYVFNTINRGTGQYNNLESVLTIPAGNTSANLTNAFTASVHDYGGKGALASTFYAIAGASNCVIWAQNSVCTDRAGPPHGPYATPLTNVRQQIENDYFVSHSTTSVRGVLNVISAIDYYAPGADGSVAHPYPPLVSQNTTNWMGFSVGLFPNSAPWDVGFSSGNGGSRVALLVGSVDYGVPSDLPNFPHTNIKGSKSQPILFQYTDNTDGTVQQSANIFIDPKFAGLTGTELRITGDIIAPLVARVDVTIDNLSYFKSLKQDKTASYPLIGLDGQNRIGIGGIDLASGQGAARVLVQTNSGVIAEFVASNPNAVNNVQIMSNSTGLPAQIIAHPAQGSGDTNIGLNINSAGTGTLALQVNGSPTTLGGNLKVTTGLGVFGVTPPTSRPAFTGAKGGNTALASVIAILVAAGIGTDSTTA
jgi:hypothetical protein